MKKTPILHGSGPGPHTVAAVLDIYGTVDESDETNNTGTLEFIVGDPPQVPTASGWALGLLGLLLLGGLSLRRGMRARGSDGTG